MSITRPLAVVAAAARRRRPDVGSGERRADATTPSRSRPAPAGSPSELTDGLVNNEQLRLRRLRAVDRRRPGPRRRRPEADGRQGDHQGAWPTNVDVYTTYQSDTCLNVYAGATAKAAVLAADRRARTRTPSAARTWSPSSRAASRPLRRSPAASRTRSTRTTSSEATSPTCSARPTRLAGAGTHGQHEGRQHHCTFLLLQQCDAGFFRQAFAGDKALADQSCDGAPTTRSSPASTPRRSRSWRCRTSR